MKKIEWINPNKMKFESPYKTFNKAVVCISDGNVIGDTQVSSFFRARNDLECNGFVNPKGHLQDWDLTEGMLQNFPHYVKSYIRKNFEDKRGIAYNFFYYKNGEKHDIGYVITTTDNKLLEIWYCGTWKSREALKECIKYITK